MATKSSSSGSDDSTTTVTTREGVTMPTLDPPDPGKTVTLTGPNGTKVTAPESAAKALKASGYK